MLRAARDYHGRILRDHFRKFDHRRTWAHFDRCSSDQFHHHHIGDDSSSGDHSRCYDGNDHDCLIDQHRILHRSDCTFSE